MAEISPEDRAEAVRKLVQARLNDPELQKQLADVFLEYYIQFRETVTLAEVLCDGGRPEGLANEVYACFQHLARGLAEDAADPGNEFQKAKNSHLKRMALDSHKIIINKALEEARPVLDVFDQLASLPHLSTLIVGGDETLSEIMSARKKIRSGYHEAMKLEGRGLVGRENESLSAVVKYEEVTKESLSLLELLREKVNGKGVLYALREHEESKKDKKKALNLSQNANRISSRSNFFAGLAIIISVFSVCIAVWAIMDGNAKPLPDSEVLGLEPVTDDL